METKNNILSALKSISVSDLSYTEWINIGMALKGEGYPCSIWDDWSRNDRRYKSGECERKWQTFQGSSTPITGATIIQMAKERGWHHFEGDGCMNWDDTIEYDGVEEFSGFATDSWKPTQDLITYLETLFDVDDKVGYVTGDVWQDAEGKWMPSKGVYDRTAGELIASLKKHPDDIGATVGDWKSQAGAWIRFNPVDGNGVKNENITKFKFALVESDTLSISEQDILYRKLELPIACLVHSGGKSLHAIVKIDAKDYDEYRRRVEFLYDFLEKNGLAVDKQNRNPSRLSRMPGVTRNGNRQYLVATNIGRKSWTDWMDFAEGIDDDLAEFDYPSEMMNDRPSLAPELIEGLLRMGHKMIIQGASKSGKSWFLIELGVSISEGRQFLDFNCRKCKVLYINLEIDRASCLNRVFKVYEAYGIQKPTKENLVVWNLRGHAMPLDKLVPIIIRRVKDQGYGVIIIDPIYKVITGDENNASEMGAFCNQFDRICDGTGCSVIYAHHHSKGAQGGKDAQDRSSGSGVFARDPDAIVDLTRLDLTQTIMCRVADSEDDTAWLMSCITRDFKQPRDRKVWFKYPVHEVDRSGALEHSFAKGDKRASLKQYKNGTARTMEDKEEELINAFETVSMGREEVSVKELAEFLAEAPEAVESKRRAIYRFIKNSAKFEVRNGAVRLVGNTGL